MIIQLTVTDPINAELIEHRIFDDEIPAQRRWVGMNVPEWHRLGYRVITEPRKEGEQ